MQRENDNAAPVSRDISASRSAPTVVCLPHAGAAASMFRSWQRDLRPDIHVVAPQLPGRENRIAEPALDRLEPVVEDVYHEIRNHIDGPFALFGHSMGALIAYELARRLEREMCFAGALFVSAYPAPHQPFDDDEHVHELDDATLIERLRSYDGTPDDVFDDPELCRMLLPTIRSDFKICETYQHIPGPPLHSDIVAFAGRSDDEAPPNAMIGWHELTAGNFVLHRVEGNHFFLSNAPQRVLAVIRAHCVDDSTRGVAPKADLR